MSSQKSSKLKRTGSAVPAPRTIGVDPMPREGATPASEFEFSMKGPSSLGVAAKLRGKAIGISPISIALAVTLIMFGGVVAAGMIALVCHSAGVTGLVVPLLCTVVAALPVGAYVLVSRCRPVSDVPGATADAAVGNRATPGVFAVDSRRRS